MFVQNLTRDDPGRSCAHAQGTTCSDMPRSELETKLMATDSY